ncbi:FAD-binding oxidoreductase [Microbulbifer thermotolerans]|uniref:FAD-binding oxidoreductase n=1 Tax=Microbulbifer thermotolerans TaxID=252514 RepID=A0AB35HVA0_MICTH|nr:FAD-binding oxidoreductase [Microbulbifer thermotolerans]MCX2779367.1 FAD-binding oxidoreductase [Microbulbifer thermotolerans]MCX2782429.1 FAD-binding oxidoreductase [Microbulbifer thermotolerans]MCX2795014.1 FAD-binding oxidoreductase [Microbulbifer thermotolerans]MCX2800582.1 FAD-binding oxidoreductase [Microbulbifer thermotolerans]MCX2805731.1 FAD-binding oxidoreductase [Microbulbifer thermotolerans]
MTAAVTPGAVNKLFGHIDSYYASSANPAPLHPPLDTVVDADVCVIGAGYTGLSSALHLAERGYSVVVLEAERIAWGASGRNGGHVGVGQRRAQGDLEKMLGLDTAKLLWDMSVEAVRLVESLINKHGIKCDLKRGIMHLAAKRSHNEDLRAEAELLRERYGYEQIRYAEEDEVRGLVGSERYFGGQLDSGSLHLHPLNYALGLADAAAAAGVRFFEHSRVKGYRTGSPCIVETARGQVKARNLVLACNGYLGNLEPRMAGRIMPINNFVLATEPLPENLARELIANDYALQDTLFVIDYWKLSADNRLIFGGGENYTSRFPQDIRGFVRKYMLRVYPQLADTRIDYGWGGTLAITLNRMPHLGRLEPNVYYSQGYSGHGVPTATFAGKLIAEVISGTEERFDILSRIPTPAFPGGTLLRWPGLVAGMLYYSLRDKLWG